MTTADKIANHPDEVKAFASATVKAAKYSMEHPEETAQIMVRYNPILDYNTTLAQWRQSIKAMNTAYVKQHGYGVVTADRLKRTAEMVRQAFKLDVAIGPSDFYASGFITR